VEALRAAYTLGDDAPKEPPAVLDVLR
jgi:hypothetical protein